MTEYIVEESPTTYETDILGVKHGVTSYRRREEIVRCRDCKYYREHAFIMVTNISDVCLFWHGTPTKVEPNGFCAWACRKSE